MNDTPSCRRDAITGHLEAWSLTLHHHCSTSIFLELIFDSSNSASNFNSIGNVILNLAPALNAFLFPQFIWLFECNSLEEDHHQVRDDPRQSSRRGYFPRLLFTIDRYVASDYQVLYNLILHLVPSGRSLRDRVVEFTASRETPRTDILFAMSDPLRLLIIFSLMNSSQKFYSILVVCISSMYVIINNWPCLCVRDKLFVRLV